MKHLFLISFFLTVLLYDGRSHAQQIDSVCLISEISPTYMGTGDTVYDYSCGLKLNSISGIASVHVTVESDSVGGPAMEMVYHLAELTEYQTDPLVYELSLGPLEITNYSTMKIELISSSEAILEENVLDL